MELASTRRAVQKSSSLNPGSLGMAGAGWLGWFRDREGCAPVVSCSFSAVMRDPKVAATRVPPRDDIFEGESVIFVAQRVCGKKTGGEWGLCDLFGDDLSGKPLPGVDFPVSW